MFDPNMQFPNIPNPPQHIPDPSQHMIDMQQQHMMHQQLYLDPPQNVHMPIPPPTPYPTQVPYPEQRAGANHTSDQIIYRSPPPNTPMPPPGATQVPPPPVYQNIPPMGYKAPVWPLLISIVGVVMVLISVAAAVFLFSRSANNYNTGFQLQDTIWDIVGYNCMGGIILCAVALIRRFKNPKTMPVVHPVITTICSFIGIGIAIIAGIVLCLMIFGFLVLLFDFAVHWPQ